MVTLPLKFKAGKVDYNEDTNVYTPNPTKGEITIKQSEEGEGFYTFTWSPRENNVSGSIESEELLVIAGDVTWKKVKSCKTGRVYMLTFLSSGGRNLFWMQDVNEDDFDLSLETSKDKLIFDKINELFAEFPDE